MPEAFSTPNLVALSITSKELGGGGLFCPPTKIVLSNSPTTIGLKIAMDALRKRMEGVQPTRRYNCKNREIFPCALCWKFWRNGHLPSSFVGEKWICPFPFQFQEKKLSVSPKFPFKNYWKMGSNKLLKKYRFFKH